MKGNNQIKINQATMVEAIQYWLDKEMLAAPRVVNVRTATGGYPGCSEFEVDLADREQSSGNSK